MKLICINGSPRINGNSSAMVKIFSDIYRGKGYDCEFYNLNSLHFKGCQGCLACKSGGKEKCILKDELSKLLDSMMTADIIFMVSPVYFGEVTSQMKAFIDRTYSFLTPNFLTSAEKSRLPKGKKLVIGIVQGHYDEKVFNDIFPRYETFFKSHFNDIMLVRECGCISSTAIVENNKRVEKIKKAAETYAV